MNDRLRELMIQAGYAAPELAGRGQKLAELIVKECVSQAYSVGDLRGANNDMIYGADTAAMMISKHFGVEE